MSSSKKTIIEQLATLAGTAQVAPPTARSGGGSRGGKTPEQLLAFLADPISASDASFKGAWKDLSDDQVAYVIVKRGTIGGAAFAIAHQSRNKPDANAERLTQLAADYSSNRAGELTVVTRTSMEQADGLYTVKNEKEAIELCKTLMAKEPSLYDAAQRLSNAGAEPTEPTDETPAEEPSVEVNPAA